MKFWKFLTKIVSIRHVKQKKSNAKYNFDRIFLWCVPRSIFDGFLPPLASGRSDCQPRSGARRSSYMIAIVCLCDLSNFEVSPHVSGDRDRNQSWIWPHHFQDNQLIDKHRAVPEKMYMDPNVPLDKFLSRGKPHQSVLHFSLVVW